MSGSIVITDYQACTCVGFDADQTCASIRCGISGMTVSPWFYCIQRDPEIDDEDPLLTSVVPFLDPFYTENGRLIDLLIPPLKRILSTSRLKRDELSKTGIFFSVPGDAGMEEAPVTDEWFRKTVSEKMSLPAAMLAVKADNSPAAMVKVLKSAAGYLSSGKIDTAIVAGVDSWLIGERLSKMDKKRMLKSERNPDGFIPGEAASVLVLQTEEKARLQNRDPLSYIEGIGISEEPFERTERSSSGRGLKNAISEALGESQVHCRYVIGNHNGDNYRGREWGTVISLMPERLSSIEEFVHPADCTGDTGTASAGVMISYALHSFSRGYACDEKCLIWCTSDSRERAAVLIRKGQ